MLCMSVEDQEELIEYFKAENEWFTVALEKHLQKKAKKNEDALLGLEILYESGNVQIPQLARAFGMGGQTVEDILRKRNVPRIQSSGGRFSNHSELVDEAQMRLNNNRKRIERLAALPTIEVQHGLPEQQDVSMEQIVPVQQAVPMEQAHPIEQVVPMPPAISMPPIVAMEQFVPMPPAHPMQPVHPMLPAYPVEQVVPMPPVHPMQQGAPMQPVIPMEQVVPMPVIAGYPIQQYHSFEDANAAAYYPAYTGHQQQYPMYNYNACQSFSTGFSDFFG